MSTRWFEKSAKWLWREWVKPILIVLAIILPLRSSIADWMDVPTGSMLPTIVEGDRIFVNKLAYDLKVPFTKWRLATWSEPARGDIVVFRSPVENVRLVKRVIGLPGDEITLRDNRLTINREPVVYEPQRMSKTTQFLIENLPPRHDVLFTPQMPSFKTFGPIRVPDGQYFMMGDNRDNSADSRYFGFVSRDLFVGEATTVVISLDRKRYFLPRFERFLSDLQ
ncbi:signal peptidase I [bacterium]|nr:signal peptidase I [bacterium]MBU1983523.1 signal peptidase I [bacterium]